MNSSKVSEFDLSSTTVACRRNSQAIDVVFKKNTYTCSSAFYKSSQD